MAYPILSCSVKGCRFREVPGRGICVEHGGVKEDPPRCGPAPLDHMRLCGSRRRDGGPCRQPPIRGAATCRLHGGSAPQVRRRAAERVVEARAVTGIVRQASRSLAPDERQVIRRPRRRLAAVKAPTSSPAHIDLPGDVDGGLTDG